MTESEGQGIRLAKRVAALAECSRREAELLIENGAVRVDGAVVLVPQTRVEAAQQVTIEAGAQAVPVSPVTLLLHKPAGLGMGAAGKLLVPANHHASEASPPQVLARHLEKQRCMAPLEAGASGLVVYTQEWRIERKLQEDANFIEHEVMVDVAGQLAAEVAQRLTRPPARVSIGRQSEGTTGLRFAVKGLQPGQIADLCESARLTIEAMKRIRIGRVPLAALPPGHWRYLGPDERF